MRHLKTFESFEKNAKEFIDQFGEESDSAQTIGWGTPCGECNCSVEECNCGCQSCAAKQKKGVSYKREPYKQDFSVIDKDPEITR